MILSASAIHEKVLTLIDQIIGDKLPEKENYSPVEKLNIILSESLQALIFVTTLEDEFNIEFDDDQVDLEFFQDVNSTVQKVQWQLYRKLEMEQPVPVTTITDKQAFTEQFMLKNSPAIIKNGAAGWPAMKQWNLEYLRRHFGDIPQTVERTVNDVHETKEWPLRDYLDYIVTTTDKIPFYLSNCQLHLQTEMEEHYVRPSYATCWYKNFHTERKKEDLSWLFIGAANTRSLLHIDRWNTSAWNAVITGLKLWFFYDPGQEAFLYKGNPDPFNPDYERYPLLQQAKPLVCLQYPGDIVFTPSGWWHTVLNLQYGIAVTENFMNETNIDAVIEFFRKHNRPQSVNTLLQIKEQHAGSLHNV